MPDRYSRVDWVDPVSDRDSYRTRREQRWRVRESKSAWRGTLTRSKTAGSRNTRPRPDTHRQPASAAAQPAITTEATIAMISDSSRGAVRSGRYITIRPATALIDATTNAYSRCPIGM